MVTYVRRIRISILAACIATACGDDSSPNQQPDAGMPDAPDAPPSPEPSLSFYDYVQAVDITPDGRTAVFGDIATTDNKVYFVDTITHEAALQTITGSVLRDFATGVSQSGSVSALHGDPVQAGVWSKDKDWTDFASPRTAGCDQDIGGAWDISADAKVVVGVTWNGCSVEAFRWSADNGGTLTPLQLLGERIGGDPQPPDNRATVVSDDGSVVAGFAMTSIVDRAPAKWKADGTGEILPRMYEDGPGEVLSINANGAVLAGIDANDGVVWAGGTRIVLPRFDTLLPSDPVYPNAITADGRVVFGGQGDAFFGTPVAFMWSLTGGLRNVADVATAAGLAIPPNEVLMNVLAVSADGTVLIGTARNTDTLADHVFTLRLPASAID